MPDTDLHPGNGSIVSTSRVDEENLLAELEAGVRAILKSRKSSKADKLSAIGHGVKLLAIKHKIEGGDPDKGFFS